MSNYFDLTIYHLKIRAPICNFMKTSISQINQLPVFLTYQPQSIKHNINQSLLPFLFPPERGQYGIYLGC